VRPVGVVLDHPAIHRGLRGFHGVEWPGGLEELGPEGAVEPFHLAVLVRRFRFGEPMGDAVVAADLVEQHLALLAEPVGELLAVEFLTDVKPLRRI
jgi:hypothetical protein